MLVFRTVTSCGLVGGYRRFRGTYCLYLRVFSSAIQKNKIGIFTAAEISNLMWVKNVPERCTCINNIFPLCYIVSCYSVTPLVRLQTWLSVYRRRWFRIHPSFIVPYILVFCTVHRKIKEAGSKKLHVMNWKHTTDHTSRTWRLVCSLEVRIRVGGEENERKNGSKKEKQTSKGMKKEMRKKAIKE